MSRSGIGQGNFLIGGLAGATLILVLTVLELTLIETYIAAEIVILFVGLMELYEKGGGI